MFFRFRRFALELAGRLPWLAFLITRCGLAMFADSPKIFGVGSALPNSHISYGELKLQGARHFG